MGEKKKGDPPLTWEEVAAWLKENSGIVLTVIGVLTVILMLVMIARRR